MTARYIVGDTRAVLASLPDGSVDLVLSSPPFLALRSYLPADHPDKAFEIGSEATPADFLDTLLDITELCARVLAPHGSLVFELGDTYSGSGGAGGDYSDDGLRAGQNAFNGSASRKSAENAYGGGANRVGLDAFPGGFTGRRGHGSGGGNGWPMAKSLCGIPTLFAWSLAYGRNLLRPERATDPWRIRNVVAWCRPNPPVGALGDKFRPATSYLTVATKARDRWFDLDAVRNPDSDMTPGGSASSRQASGDERGQGEASRRAVTGPIPNPAGAPPLDWWEIPTQPYKGSHYATWPERLCVRPIDAMCPRQVCRTCGEPRRRITDSQYVTTPDDSTRIAKAGSYRLNAHDHAPEIGWERTHETLGWSSCGHDDYRRGITLDPFAGSGTTLKVAEGLGRDSIGIDLDGRNAELAAERVGMFLTVETLEPAGLLEEQ